MQALIYETKLVVESVPSWLTPDSLIELQLQSDGRVAAFAHRPSRWMFLFGGWDPVRVGVLDDGVGALLRPVLEAGTALQVRIVELQPPRMANDRSARISVSVWTGKTKMISLRPGRLP